MLRLALLGDEQNAAGDYEVGLEERDEGNEREGGDEQVIHPQEAAIDKIISVFLHIIFCNFFTN